MGVPDYQSLMAPLLQFAADGEEHSLREAINHLASAFGLTKEELDERLPSGRQTTFANRVGWARTYLAKAGLLTTTRRGYFQVSERGVGVLNDLPDRIDNRFLKQFPEFRAFRARSTKGEGATIEDSNDEGDEDTGTPEEELEGAYQKIRNDLASELLEAVHAMSPAFFERLVVELLVKMGYGGTLQDAGRAIGRSGDGGIDGIIKEDRLGLDIVYLQAKKWDPGKNISRPEIQKFAGALQGQRAKKGVFITTADFAATAYEYVSRIDSKIVLINGETLAELMIDYGLGVSTVATYEHKRLDSDYFAEE